MKLTPGEIYDGDEVPQDDRLGYLINRVGWDLRKNLDRMMATEGLTVQQGVILHVRYEGRARTPTEFARALAIDTSAVTRLLDRLERKGLVNRVFDPNDRRSVVIELTKKGEEVAPKFHALTHENQLRFFGGFKKEDLDKMKELLKIMLKRAEGLENAEEDLVERDDV
ncbi:MAG: MarR family winged helix-turn-helix transcriptional regulator [Nitrospinota bacterium]